MLTTAQRKRRPKPNKRAFAFDRDGEAFSPPDVPVLSGLSDRNSRLYYDVGVVRASVRDSGPGVPRLFNFGDIFAAWLTNGLRELGAGWDSLRAAGNLFYSQGFSPAKPFMVVEPTDARLVSQAEADRLLRGPAPIMIVNLIAAAKKLRAEVDAQLAKRK